ncbi:hypothetical protein [Nannocystis bainbridge]|uniref:Receptor L-domain domain-containing protein n=1 Tax=Nannocystis bainbridge TaxID=2995303 RepID=A0ABT5DQ51_9BACT|nr:hypothetical protein [Nannocystis bainbridge]MDC0715777.1 hypothetical protein [Nannocystis bainbridge]
MTRLTLSSSSHRALALDSLVLTAGLSLFAACPGESGTGTETASTEATDASTSSQGSDATGPTTSTTEESTAPLTPDSESSEGSSGGETSEGSSSGETSESSTSEVSSTGETSESATGESSTGEDSTTGSTSEDSSTGEGSTGEPIDCAPDLEVLGGSFSIENSLDVAALAAYGEITGDLTIHAPGLTSLAGLQCLRRVGGDLEIVQTALASLDGLDSLEEVGGQLVIEANAPLASLHALAKLTSIGATPQGFGRFELIGHPSLKDLQGLGALSFVGGSVKVSGNGIESLVGLGAATIDGEIRFEYNGELVDVLDVAAFLPKSTAYFGHNKKLWCGNAEMAHALMKANGFKGSMALYDNLDGCGFSP